MITLIHRATEARQAGCEFRWRFAVRHGCYDGLVLWAIHEFQRPRLLYRTDDYEEARRVNATLLNEAHVIVYGLESGILRRRKAR